jgi:dienelactone hydrolase
MIVTSTTPGVLAHLICIGLGMAAFVAYAASMFTPGRLIVLATATAALGFIAALIVLARRLRRPAAIARSLAVILLAVVAGSYAILFGIVYFLQDAIADQTNAFFQPQPLRPEAAQASALPQVEPLEFTAPDGIRLRGWLVRNSDGGRAPLLIYFGGSGSEASQMIPYAQRLAGWSVALVNYRGFGESEGTPGHAFVLADVALVYDSLAQRSDVDASRIVGMGYSMGTGVAVHLAAQRPVAGTVLVAPYDRQTLIGLKQAPVYAPLSGVMKRYFDSLSLAPAIASPMLCLLGSADTVIPNEISLRLVDAWGGPTEVKTYAGEDHDLLLHPNASWTDIADFLDFSYP